MHENTNQLGVNLVGVLKAIVRDVAYERETINEANTSTNRSGDKWFATEETQLWEEFVKFTELAAVSHKRSAGAIRSRLLNIARNKIEF